MKKSTQNILLIVGGLLISRYIYKKYSENTSLADVTEGTMSACEEMASTTRFNNKDERDSWVKDCMDKDAYTSEPENDCELTASKMRFNNPEARARFIEQCKSNSN